MKASFTSRDYSRILELAWLGLWVAGDRPDDPESVPERYADAGQKLFSFAATFGCADLVKAGPDATLRPSSKLAGGTAREKLDQFIDDTFWAELVQRLAERDLRAELGATKLGDELSEEETARLHQMEDNYWREFEERGVDHIVLLRGGRE
jgi:hypothetical protein